MATTHEKRRHNRRIRIIEYPCQMDNSQYVLLFTHPILTPEFIYDMGISKRVAIMTDEDLTLDQAMALAEQKGQEIMTMLSTAYLAELTAATKIKNR